MIDENTMSRSLVISKTISTKMDKEVDAKIAKMKQLFPHVNFNVTRPGRAIRIVVTDPFTRSTTTKLKKLPKTVLTA